jgi:hypothetical protein
LYDIELTKIFEVNAITFLYEATEQFCGKSPNYEAGQPMYWISVTTYGK